MDLSAKTICITGVGGFIGLRMAERAMERGLSVRGLELSPAAAERARRIGVQVTEGDLCDPDVAETAISGSDLVFHTAAIVAEDESWEASRKVNVQGTATLARTARKLGTRRFVHLSSVMVYGFDYAEGVGEDGPFDGACNPYCQTKLESDQVVLAMHDPERLEVTVIRPGDVYGRGCPSWVVRPIELMKKGMFAYIDGGRPILNHVHVDNLLDAVFVAIERDAVGAAFNVTDGERTTCREFFGHYASWLGKGGFVSLPSALAVPAFSALERAMAALDRPSAVRAAAVHFMRREHTYSIDKARRELDYVPRVTLQKGMADLRTWAQAQGLLD